MDGDGKCEVVFLTRDSVVHVVDGATGREKAKAQPPVPDGATRWEVAMLADFRGHGGDRDVLLQATNKRGYRMGRYLAAYAVEQLVKLQGRQLCVRIDPERADVVTLCDETGVPLCQATARIRGGRPAGGGLQARAGGWSGRPDLARALPATGAAERRDRALPARRRGDLHLVSDAI